MKRNKKKKLKKKKRVPDRYMYHVFASLTCLTVPQTNRRRQEQLTPANPAPIGILEEGRD